MKKLSDEMQARLDEKLKEFRAVVQTDAVTPLEKALHSAMLEGLERDLQTLRIMKVQALKLEAMLDCNPVVH